MAHKVGLALGGGGARGSFQIGVIKALMDAGILDQVKVVSGTSIGAIHALMVMAGISYERMYDLWTTIDKSVIFGTESRLKMDRLGLFSIQDLYDVFAHAVTLDEVKQSKIQGFATAAKINKNSLIDQVMINRMEKVVFDLNHSNDPHQAALASASIPIVFGPDDYNEQHYVDGGAVDMIPIQPLIDQGCDIIISVPIFGKCKQKEFKDQNVLIIEILQYKLFDIIGLDVMDFDIEKVPRRVDYGAKLTKFMINKLAETGFYNKNHHSWHKPDTFMYVGINKKEEATAIQL